MYASMYKCLCSRWLCSFLLGRESVLISHLDMHVHVKLFISNKFNSSSARICTLMIILMGHIKGIQLLFQWICSLQQTSVMSQHRIVCRQVQNAVLQPHCCTYNLITIKYCSCSTATYTVTFFRIIEQFKLYILFMTQAFC